MKLNILTIKFQSGEKYKKKKQKDNLNDHFSSESSDFLVLVAAIITIINAGTFNPINNNKSV